MVNSIGRKKVKQCANDADKQAGRNVGLPVGVVG
jgi:hypothetical protein